MSETEKPKVDPKQLEKIDEELNKARRELVSTETQSAIDKAREEARAQALQEAEVKKQLEEKEKEIAAMKKRIEDQEKNSAEKLQMFQKSIDEMKESQAIVNVKDPFKEGGKSTLDPEKMSDEEINRIEMNSGRQFFGPEFDERF